MKFVVQVATAAYQASRKGLRSGHFMLLLIFVGFRCGSEELRIEKIKEKGLKKFQKKRGNQEKRVKN